jgi:hypothetical protein
MGRTTTDAYALIPEAFETQPPLREKNMSSPYTAQNTVAIEFPSSWFRNRIGGSFGEGFDFSRDLASAAVYL